MSSGHIRLAQADTPERVAIARALFREYALAIGSDLDFQGFSAELRALPGPYSPPAGALLIAQAGEAIAGCVALRSLDRHTGEMKRLYVRPDHRSGGLGERLVQAVIDAACAAGYRELRLDTLPTMTAAQGLYRRLGFLEIPPYGDKALPGTRFFARPLPAG